MNQVNVGESCLNACCSFYEVNSSKSSGDSSHAACIENRAAQFGGAPPCSFTYIAETKVLKSTSTHPPTHRDHCNPNSNTLKLRFTPNGPPSSEKLRLALLAAGVSKSGGPGALDGQLAAELVSARVREESLGRRAELVERERDRGLRTLQETQVGSATQRLLLLLFATNRLLDPTLVRVCWVLVAASHV